MKSYLISVVIPAYNSALFICETVASALSQKSPYTGSDSRIGFCQTRRPEFALGEAGAKAGMPGQGKPILQSRAVYFDVEAVVTDDGSADETAALARSAGAMVVRKENGGISSSRNTGVALARGDLLLFLDGDDRLRPGALQALFEGLIGKQELGAVFGMAQDFISPELTPHERGQLRPRREPYFGLVTGCMLIWREAFDKVGLFDERLRTGEAVEWLLRLRDRGIETGRIDFISADRRLHMTNTGRLHRMQEKRDYARILRHRLIEKESGFAVVSR